MHITNVSAFNLFIAFILFQTKKFNMMLNKNLNDSLAQSLHQLLTDTLSCLLLIVSGPYNCRALFRKAFTIVLVTSSKNICVMWECMAYRNSKATEKSKMHVFGLSGKPGRNLHIVNMWLNSFPSVHSDRTRFGLARVTKDVYRSDSGGKPTSSIHWQWPGLSPNLVDSLHHGTNSL